MENCIEANKHSDGGEARIFGKDARKHRKEIFEKIGVQLQASNYQSQIRVNEICTEMSALYREPADYHELLRRFHLEQFEKSKVSQLSGGERQKQLLAVQWIFTYNGNIIICQNSLPERGDTHETHQEEDRTDGRRGGYS